MKKAEIKTRYPNGIYRDNLGNVVCSCDGCLNYTSPKPGKSLDKWFEREGVEKKRHKDVCDICEYVEGLKWNPRKYATYKFKVPYCESSNGVEDKNGKFGCGCGFTKDEWDTSVLPEIKKGNLEPAKHWFSALGVDHLDGNHSNDKEENLSTVCGSHHNQKTRVNGDNLSNSKKFKKSMEEC